MIVTPYPGLRPFTPEEADIFFGREEHIDQLLEKLCFHRFISAVGPPGCGKSSLIRAGMIAALKNSYFANTGVYWRVAKMRPGRHPLQNLAEALISGSVLESEGSKSTREQTQAETRLLPFLVSSLRRESRGLVEVLRETRLPRRTNVLLVIDQFEEIFRYHQNEVHKEVEAFVALLLESAKQEELPIYVVTTICSDFIGECTLFPDLPEMMNIGQFWVSCPTSEQQRMAIIGPAGIFGSSVDSHLVNHLLHEMETDAERLPALQHCLMRMWFQARARMGMTEEELKPTLSGLPTTDGITITLEDYEAVGGLKDALSRHAEGAFEELNEKQKEIAKCLFRGLSEYDRSRHGVRRPIQLDEVAAIAGFSVPEVVEVVETFRHPERCFMTPAAGVPLDADSVLDMSYENLLRQWYRMSEWAKQETESADLYRRLEQTAWLWKKEQAALWNAPDLDIALAWKEEEKPTAAWAKRYGNHFDLAMEFLDASKQTQEQKRQEENHKHRQGLRRVRQQLAGVLSGFIVIVLLCVWAFWERSNAKHARTLIEENRQKALSNSYHFKELSKATFGFLGESEQKEAFLTWIWEKDVIEELDSMLTLMIDISEIKEEEQEYWHRELPSMTVRHKLELLDILGTGFFEESRHKKGKESH